MSTSDIAEYQQRPRIAILSHHTECAQDASRSRSRHETQFETTNSRHVKMASSNITTNTYATSGQEAYIFISRMIRPTMPDHETAILRPGSSRLAETTTQRSVVVLDFDSAQDFLLLMATLSRLVLVLSDPRPDPISGFHAGSILPSLLNTETLE